MRSQQTTLLAATLISVSTLARAQPPDPRPAYEAVVIKLNSSGNPGARSDGTGSQVLMVNQTMKRLLERALNVKPDQIIGPPWIETVRFDISAKYPVNTKREDRPAMLKTLLEGRFGLAGHQESRDMPGFNLVVAKGGFKLKPMEPGEGSRDSSKGNDNQVDFKAERLTIGELAVSLGRELGSWVVDKTGIEGHYTFQMKWTPEQEGPPPSNLGDPNPGPSLNTQLQELLGLRLQSSKVPVPVFVVDKLDRVPKEN